MMHDSTRDQSFLHCRSLPQNTCYVVSGASETEALGRTLNKTGSRLFLQRGQGLPCSYSIRSLRDHYFSL